MLFPEISFVQKLKSLLLLLLSNMASTSVKMIRSLHGSGSEGSRANPLKFKGQDYEQLKEGLLKQGRLFKDEAFPADVHSLGNLDGFTAEQLKEVEWLRPRDLHSNAAFVVDGTSRFDFQQGGVGNCWFLASLGSLTLCDSSLAEVVPLDQSFKDNYAGIFHFRFWRFGKWTDVVIDDLLPTIRKRPVSVSSKSENEFWAPLLEKAYAKVCGSYGDMIAGSLHEAFKDFSGGVNMIYILSESTSELWNAMNRATQCNAMMACGTFTGEKGKETCNKFGLVDGHAFAVTGVKQVESQGQNVKLVRIWNPWGKKEWNGDWSDKSKLWTTVSQKVQEECHEDHDNGEFWMKMGDFCRYFRMMCICHDSPNFMDGDTESQWTCWLKEGSWKAGVSAGGFNLYSEEFWTNPQYRLRLKGENKRGSNVLLSLMQKPEEEHRKRIKYHYTTFVIFQVPPKVAPTDQLTPSLFLYSSPVRHVNFHKTRELIELHRLEPGDYLLIPCTYESNQEASFNITIYCKDGAVIE